VSLHFEAAKMHGIIGPEGAGKTTLMRTLLGLLRPNGGEIDYVLNGNKISFDTLRGQIAYMPQQQSLYPDLSIDEHLDFFRALFQIPKEIYKEQKERLLSITRLGGFLHRPAGKLSGGMYKKLGLMCALLRSPDILLLDEPTNGVDPISRREFWDLLYQLVDRQILILVTTAYMDEAERCMKIHLLEAGKVINTGEPRDLLKREGVENFDQLFLRSEKRVG
jgi:ABC-2 type transport system ATP-binding protein